MTENKKNKEQSSKRQKQRCEGKDQGIKKDKKQTQTSKFITKMLEG